MKKRFLFIILLTILILNIFIISVKADSSSPNVPSTTSIPIIGDINPDTGQPKTFEQFQQFATNAQNAEQNKSFLMQEWSIILYKNQYIGPVLFYTENFFSMFNPFWNIIFGIVFSWSFAFFVALGIWIMFIFIFYEPSKALTNINLLFSLIFSVILASIMGVTGVIRKAVEILGFAISNLWILGISILIAVFIMILYTMIFKTIGKIMKAAEKKEKLERSEDKINTAGDVAGKMLDK